MGRLRALAPRLATLDTRKVRMPEKTADPIYHTAEYQAWREEVIARAGRRCEEVVNGKRCWKAEPHNRMFADHVIELRDGGAPFDPSNGRCLCGAHHTLKTIKAREARHTP